MTNVLWLWDAGFRPPANTPARGGYVLGLATCAHTPPPSIFLCSTNRQPSLPPSRHDFIISKVNIYFKYIIFTHHIFYTNSNKHYRYTHENISPNDSPVFTNHQYQWFPSSPPTPSIQGLGTKLYPIIPGETEFMHAFGHASFKSNTPRGVIAFHATRHSRVLSTHAPSGFHHCCPTKMWLYSWFGTDFLLKGNSRQPPFARNSEPWRSITQFFTH